MKLQTYTISVEHDIENNKMHIHRKNDGFSAIELLGLCAMIQHEVLDQMRGTIKPHTITREVVKDEPANNVLDLPCKKS